MGRINPYGIPDRQWEFVQEYLTDFDVARAYRAAHYKVTTDQAAWVNGCRLLRNAKLRQILRAEKERLVASLDVTPEKVVREFGRLGFSDMRQYATWGPRGVTLADSTQLSEDAAMAVAEVSETTGPQSHTIRFKLHSKTDALNSLARYFDLFKEAEGMQQLGTGLAALLDFAKGPADAEPS